MRAAKPIGPEVFAVRYGSVSMRRSQFFFDFARLCEADTEMMMDYFFFVIRLEEETILVDCGFDADVARRRGRTPLVSLEDGLAEVGLRIADIDRVLITHFHYDHIGNLGRLGDARWMAQAREVEFWNSPVSKRARFMEVAEPAELHVVEDAFEDGRLEVLHGDATIAPGVFVELVGGHTPGQQIVRVNTAAGEIVLASDALHCYEELEKDLPFVHFCDLAGMYATFDRLRELERCGATIVAGHDPLVVERFDPTGANSAPVVIRLEPLVATN